MSTRPGIRRSLSVFALASLLTATVAAEDPSPLARWTAALAQKNSVAARWQATYELGLLGAEAAPAVPALTKSLADEHEYVAGGAAWALGRIGPAAAAAVAPLTDAAQSPLLSVRRHAVEALGRIGKAAGPAVGKLMDRLAGDDPVVRVQAAAALWRIARYEKTIPTLADFVTKSADAGYDAAIALGELGKDAEPALPALIRAMEHRDADTARAAAWAVARIGPAAIAPLTTTIHAEQAVPRRRAVDVLAALGPNTVPLLTEALSDRDALVRRAAARGLGQLGPLAAASAESLLRAVNDTDNDVRQEAARALRQVRTTPDSQPRP